MRILIPILLFLAFIRCKPTEGKTILHDAVLYVTGKKLLPNANYNIIPNDYGRGGGLKIYRRNSTCPFNVAQAKSWRSYGDPLTFLPINSSDKAIRLSTDMNIAFRPTNTICRTSMVWRVSELDNAKGRRYVTVGGVTGNPSPSTWRNWFKIERSGEDYKLVFCPRVCSHCKRMLCGDVGSFEGDRYRWLGLRDVPLQVMFVRAGDK